MNMSNTYSTIDNDIRFPQAAPCHCKSHPTEHYLFQSEIASDTRLNRIQDLSQFLLDLLRRFLAVCALYEAGEGIVVYLRIGHVLAM